MANTNTAAAADEIALLTRTIPQELIPIITRLLKSLVDLENRLDITSDNMITINDIEHINERIEAVSASLSDLETKLSLFENLNINESSIDELLAMKPILLEMKDNLVNIRDGFTKSN